VTLDKLKESITGLVDDRPWELSGDPDLDLQPGEAG
jgi:hypothetical protein